MIENKDPIIISLGFCFSPGSIHMKSDFQEEIAKKDSISLNRDIVWFYSKFVLIISSMYMNVFLFSCPIICRCISVQLY